MVIGGFQKLSLIDYPGHVASVVFTQGCMFRCGYCHNPDLIALKKEAGVSVETVLEHLRHHAAMLDGLCITGGEPTLHKDLPEFIRSVKDIGLKVKLDTNGINPRMIQDLIDANLVDYFAMDVKHRWEEYNSIVRMENPTALKNVEDTFRLIQNSGVDHEFRTTVLPEQHTTEDFMAIVGYLQPGEKYFVQDIRYDVTLDDTLDASKHLDVASLITQLRAAFPKIAIEAR